MQRKIARIAVILLVVVLAVGALSIPIGYAVRSHLYESGKLFESNPGLMYDLVETKVSEAVKKPGCFYNEETGSFGIPGVELGADIHTVVRQLGMEEWAPEDSIESFLAEDEEGLTFAFNQWARMPIFDHDFTLTYHCIVGNGCNMLEFTANLVEPDYRKLRTPEEAYEIVHGIFEQFFGEYGQAAASNYPETTLDSFTDFDQLSDEIYALWENGEPGERSFIVLSSYLAKGYESGREVYLKIFVGVEADGFNMDAEFSRFMEQG